MKKKIEVSLCMGSSCFTRGNNRLLEAVEGLIRKNSWEELVELSGSRCENRCGDGPNVVVDGVLHQRLDEGALMDLIAEKVGTLSGQTLSR